jgi:hypothetical protein
MDRKEYDDKVNSNDLMHEALGVIKDCQVSSGEIAQVYATLAVAQAIRESGQTNTELLSAVRTIAREIRR